MYKLTYRGKLIDQFPTKGLCYWKKAQLLKSNPSNYNPKMFSVI